MSIEVSNESGIDVSEEELISVARFVIRKMNVNPAAELSMVLLDLAAMAPGGVTVVVVPGRDAWFFGKRVTAATPSSSSPSFSSG